MQKRGSTGREQPQGGSGTEPGEFCGGSSITIAALGVGAMGLGSCSAFVAPAGNCSAVMWSCSGYMAVPGVSRGSSRSVLEYPGCNWCLGTVGWKAESVSSAA